MFHDLMFMEIYVNFVYINDRCICYLCLFVDVKGKYVFRIGMGDIVVMEKTNY